MSSYQALAFLLLCCAWIGNYGSFGQDWDYGTLGPDVWPDLYQACGGSAQSPIDIPVWRTRFTRLPRFRLSSSYFNTQRFQLINEGGSISALLASGSPTLSVTGGGLPGTYRFVNFHFHWGQNYASGSEHKVNGKKYAAELHIVHQNPDTQALAVLGFLIEAIRGEDTATDAVSEGWRNYFAAGSELTNANDTGSVSLNLGPIIRNNMAKFWRYNGSLTNPPCTQGVTWTVFTKPLQIYDSNILLFRENVFALNYRDPQPLNRRRVLRNFPRPGSWMN